MFTDRTSAQNLFVLRDTSRGPGGDPFYHARLHLPAGETSSASQIPVTLIKRANSPWTKVHASLLTGLTGIHGRGVVLGAGQTPDPTLRAGLTTSSPTYLRSGCNLVEA